VARIAGILHMAATLGDGAPWQAPISADTVTAAIRLGREYLLPHAIGAFNLMGADPRLEDGLRVLRWLREYCDSVKSEKGGALSRIVSKRDIHARVFGGSRKVPEVDAVIQLLVDHYFVRPVEITPAKSRGRKPSIRYELNPQFLASTQTEDPVSHNSQFHRNGKSQQKPGENEGTEKI
jgi:hypothetical protein